MYRIARAPSARVATPRTPGDCAPRGPSASHAEPSAAPAPASTANSPLRRFSQPIGLRLCARFEAGLRLRARFEVGLRFPVRFEAGLRFVCPGAACLPVPLREGFFLLALRVVAGFLCIAPPGFSTLIRTGMSKGYRVVRLCASQPTIPEGFTR